MGRTNESSTTYKTRVLQSWELWQEFEDLWELRGCNDGALGFRKRFLFCYLITDRFGPLGPVLRFTREQLVRKLALRPRLVKEGRQAQERRGSSHPGVKPGLEFFNLGLGLTLGPLEEGNKRCTHCGTHEPRREDVGIMAWASGSWAVEGDEGQIAISGTRPGALEVGEKIWSELHSGRENRGYTRPFY